MALSVPPVVTEFLRDALAVDALGVPELEARVRATGLLHLIPLAKPRSAHHKREHAPGRSRSPKADQLMPCSVRTGLSRMWQMRLMSRICEYRMLRNLHHNRSGAGPPASYPGSNRARCRSRLSSGLAIAPARTSPAECDQSRKHGQRSPRGLRQGFP
jgi:hypothetical protein